MSTITATHPLRPTAHARPGSVRLTRRGRLVVVALAVLTVLAVGVLFASGSVATDEPGTPEPTRVVQVGVGDTLWDIAAGLAGDGDTRAMIDRIEELNALDSGMVVAGQKLVVPIGG
ncbi:MAG: LysM peptidoglycan-binding domain-containing protein [Nocardioides sp.]|nr:LysM peptidoglycan-binding domain-containing protein [Nocardioidaceae bacterium]MCB8957524.1 LysM peptidoglycan-binding domain-containing protein [Nocardioides sp.]